MIRAKYIYIDGVSYPDSSNRKWTAEEIDAAYASVCQSLGRLNPPPNEWYPMNILGYSNYSISKHKHHIMNNKFNRLIEGTIYNNQYKFKMTNDSGEKQKTEYAGRLLARMFLPPPPSNTSPMVCYHDRNPMNCNLFNVYWKGQKIEGPVGKPSAKPIKPPKEQKTPVIIHFQRTPNPAENDEAIDAMTIARQVKEAWNKPTPTTTSKAKTATTDVPCFQLSDEEDDEAYARRMHSHSLSQRRPKPRKGGFAQFR
jgi:hypothetical protein